MGTGGRLEGSVIEGYEVLSVLGSGATGLLYEARHVETGEVAILRRWHDDEGQDLLAIFVREASPFLAPGPGAPQAEVFNSPDGTEVLLLRRPRAQRPASMHPATERVLPRARPTAGVGRTWLAVGAAGGLLLLVGAALLARQPGAAPAERPAPPPPAPPAAAQPSTVAPEPPPPAPVPPVPEPPVRPAIATDAPGAVARPPALRPEKVKPVAVKVSVKETSDCQPDDEWKRQAGADLDELTQRAAKRGDLLLWAAEENDALSRAIATASSRGECATIEGRLRQFNQRLKGKGAER